MKHLITFLIFSASILGITDIYFEYFINREMSLMLSTPATLFMIIIFVLYITYLVKLLYKLLKLKK